MDLKDKNFACFSKKSKKGTDYYSGEVRIDGKLYWINIFEKKSKNGSRYLSGILNEKGIYKKETIEEQKETVDKWASQEIPF